MSYIFDALRRSEAERSGIDSAALPGATVLLQRAERRAMSKWEASIRSQKSIPMGAAGLDPRSMSEAKAQATKELENSIVKLSGSQKPPDAFGPFKSLQVSLDPQSCIPCLTDNGSPVAEAFRLLGVRLRHLRRQRPLKTVLITSTIPQEGKSLVAANLACTLALRTHERTLLVEGDLRRPTLSQRFGIGTNSGLSECLRGEGTLLASVHHLENANLWILPAGNALSNAQEILQLAKLSSLMDELVKWFDWIIIDTPPVLPLADTSVWMRSADGILLTTRCGTTQKMQLLRSMEVLDPKKLIGALINNSNIAEGNYYYSPSGALGPEYAAAK